MPAWARLSGGACALALLAAQARADQPDESNEVSVPRGSSGAVIVPQPPPGSAAAAITPPAPVAGEPPIYPEEALRAGVQGQVVLKLTIDRTGAVTAAEVHAGASHGLDAAALAAARTLRFEPARKGDGTPVATRILYRYEFTLEPAARPLTAVREHIEGVVRTRAGDAPIAGATVKLRAADGSERSATTDADGRFRFDELAPGSYALAIEAAGFEPASFDEALAQGEALDARYRLDASTAPGEGLEVLVQGDRPPRDLTRRRLEQRELDRIPGTRGDALHALQNLPGIARARLGLLVVRGSAPQDTQYFVDGTPVPLIYHFGGLASAVPTEALAAIDFYPGNFSTQFGRGMGGVVDVKLRSPSPDGEYHGLAQLDLIDGRVLLEGPIEIGEGWSFLVAGRRSWIDAILAPILTSRGADVTQAPVYYDYQFMLEHRGARDRRFRAAFFGSDDGVALVTKPPEGEPAVSGSLDFHTAFQRAQLRYDHPFRPGSELCAVMAYGRESIDVEIAPFFLFVKTHALTSRLELSQRLGESVRLNLGSDLDLGMGTVTVRVPGQPPAGHPDHLPFSTQPPLDADFAATYARPAAYVEAEWTPHARVRLVPGVRTDYAIEGETLDLSPRVNARFLVVDGERKTTVKGGVGVFHQPPQLQEILGPFGSPDLESNRAIHYGLGVEQDVTRQIDVALEGYYKHLGRLVVQASEEPSDAGGRGRAGAAGGGSSLRGIGTPLANEGGGYAAGGELLVKYKPDDHFFGWIAYSLSRSVRTRPGRAETLHRFDQTHNLTVIGSYRIGAGWELGARFRVVSGRVITPIVCDPEDEGCDAKRINAFLHAPSGTYESLPAGERNSERVPLFHQLDMRVDKTWTFAEWKLSAYIDAQNVYFSQNVENVRYNFNFSQRADVLGLPFLPSFGLRGQF